MSDNSAKRLLTTGELAQECGVTVRTVQYYDEKGLLSPTQRSEGGRRLYDEQALATMRTICLLKALGLTLKAIRGVLESDGSPEVLQCLLEQQEIELMGKVECDQDMLKAVRAELTRLRHEDVHETTMSETKLESEAESHEEPESNPGVERTMSKIFADPGTRLYRTQRKMLLEGIVLDIVEISCIVIGIVTGNWWPLAAALPLIIIIVVELIGMYHRDARYVCPHCRAVFQPAMREFFFASHTPKTRRLTCTSCNTKDWCVEVPADQGRDA